MRRLLLALSFLLLAHGIVTGQDDQTPWPPDPVILFAEGIEALAVELVDMNVTPRSFADNERRIVRIYHEASDEWQEYSYPEDSGENYFLRERSDGTFLLTAGYPRVFWLINPTENTVTPLNGVCGGEAPALPGEGEWYYVVDEEAERVYLCFTEGDERILLPPEISKLASEHVREPTISPDGDWVIEVTVVAERVNEQNFYSYDIYSYEIATAHLNHLGRIHEMHMATFPPSIWHDWVSDTQGLVSYGPPQELSRKSYYSFDVSQADSLELILEGWMYDFYDNPPRYEYVFTSGFLSWKSGSRITPGHHKPCVFFRYDATGAQQHELGYDCIGTNIVAENNHLITLRVDSDPAEFSTLMRYDLNTREFTEIVSDEIEWWFGGLYPYALLLMDDSGQIDLIDFYPMYGLQVGMSEYQWVGKNVEGAYIAVLDTTTGEFVYDSSSIQRASSEGDVFGQWVTDDRFVYSLDRGNPSLTLVMLGEDVGKEYTVEGVSPNMSTGLHFSPDGYRMLVYMPQERTIGIANFLSGEATPLFNSRITADYNVFFEWIDNNTLSVRVAQKGHSGIASAVYTVQVP